VSIGEISPIGCNGFGRKSGPFRPARSAQYSDETPAAPKEGFDGAGGLAFFGAAAEVDAVTEGAADSTAWTSALLGSVGSGGRGTGERRSCARRAATPRSALPARTTTTTIIIAQRREEPTRGSVTRSCSPLSIETSSSFGFDFGLEVGVTLAGGSDVGLGLRDAGPDRGSEAFRAAPLPSANAGGYAATSSSANVTASGMRSFGSRISARATTSATGAGTHGATSTSDGGGCITMATAVSWNVGRSAYAGRPASISYRSAPSAQRSTRWSKGKPCTCSGAMYCGVPIV
jgi:hypothetical protein